MRPGAGKTGRGWLDKGSAGAGPWAGAGYGLGLHLQHPSAAAPCKGHTHPHREVRAGIPSLPAAHPASLAAPLQLHPSPRPPLAGTSLPQAG